MQHPLAGGAETVSSQIMEHMVRDGHEVHLLTARFQGSLQEETVNGVRIYRQGNRVSVYMKAWRQYRKQYRSWPDLVIDEMNTIPFAFALYGKQRSILLTYQLARQVWLYQMPLPISWVGYTLEPLYLQLLSRQYKIALTESQSTKNELVRYGFKASAISVFRIGMALEPLKKLPNKQSKTVLILGAMRPMKRTLDAVKAFEVARDIQPDLRLVVAGDKNGAYAKKVVKYIARSHHADCIKIHGRVTDEERLHLMRDAAVILVTSVKEGWGLIVTEANSQGTPAVAYDVDGLRDSVHHETTGILVPNGDYAAMGKAVIDLVADQQRYEIYRHAAWKDSQQYTFENSYQDFCLSLKLALK